VFEIWRADRWHRIPLIYVSINPSELRRDACSFPAWSSAAIQRRLHRIVRDCPAHVSFFLFTDRALVILVLLEASGRPDASADNRVGLHREKPENARVVREHKGDSRGVLTADRKISANLAGGRILARGEYPQAGIHPPDSPLNFFSRQRPRRSIRKGARGTARCLEFSRRTRGAGILSLLGYAERARLFGASWIRHESLYVSLPPGRETSGTSETVHRGLSIGGGSGSPRCHE